SILLPNSRLEDHYYVAISNAGDVSEPMVHFFSNLKSEAASLLISHITDRLNCPFALKAAFDPNDYQRCDSCILTVRKSDYQSAWETVKIFHRLHYELFLDAIPFLTKPLGTGFAIASSSALEHCSRIADILLKCREQSSPADGNRLLRHNAELPSKLSAHLASELLL
nr:T3SS effector HopA1 family protein [Leptolyngbya sp. Prado105]